MYGELSWEEKSKGDSKEYVDSLTIVSGSGISHNQNYNYKSESSQKFS